MTKANVASLMILAKHTGCLIFSLQFNLLFYIFQFRRLLNLFRLGFPRIPLLIAHEYCAKNCIYMHILCAYFLTYAPLCAYLICVYIILETLLQADAAVLDDQPKESYAPNTSGNVQSVQLISAIRMS